MTAAQALVASWGGQLAGAKAELADCRRRNLRVMTKYWQRAVCRLYLNLRRARSWA